MRVACVPFPRPSRPSPTSKASFFLARRGLGHPMMKALGPWRVLASPRRSPRFAAHTARCRRSPSRPRSTNFHFFFFFQFQVREKRRWGFFLSFPRVSFPLRPTRDLYSFPPVPHISNSNGQGQLVQAAVGIEVKFVRERQNDRGARRTQRRARDREERSPRRGGARGRGARRGPLSSSPDPHFLSV